MNPEVWSAAFSGVSAIAAVATGGIAAYTLAGSRRDSRDRTRPVVIAVLRRGPAMTHGYAYLDVSNAGQSVAKYVRVRFTPSIAEQGSADATAKNIVDRYSQPIELIAPGQHLVNVWSNTAAGFTPLPEKVTAHLEYRDERNRSYSETFKLTTAHLGTETVANPSGKEYEKRVAKALESLNWETWAK